MVPILQALQTLQKSPVFPNLHVLRITMANPPPPFPFIHCLFFHSIRKISLDVTRSLSGGQNHDVIAEILHTTRFLQLEELEFTACDTSVIVCPIIALAVSDAIVAQPLLRQLKVLDLKDRFLLPWSTASRLHHLTHVMFHEMDAFEDPWNAVTQADQVSQVSGFPTLRHAAFGVALNGLTSVLAAITSTDLQELRLVVQTPEEENEMDAALNDRLYGIKRFSNLTTLHILFAGIASSLDDFLPLFACHSLCTLIIRGKGLSTSVDDDGIETMAISWPVLEELEIIDSDPESLASPTPHITIHGLNRAARHFHLLRKLCISIDARRPDLCQPDEFASTTMEDVRFPLSLVSEEPSSQKEVARLIRAMWPKQHVPVPKDLSHWLLTRHQIMTFDLPVVLKEGDPWPYVWMFVYFALASSDLT